MVYALYNVLGVNVYATSMLLWLPGLGIWIMVLLPHASVCVQNELPWPPNVDLLTCFMERRARGKNFKPFLNLGTSSKRTCLCTREAIRIARNKSWYNTHMHVLPPRGSIHKERYRMRRSTL